MAEENATILNFLEMVRSACIYKCVKFSIHAMIITVFARSGNLALVNTITSLVFRKWRSGDSGFDNPNYANFFNIVGNERN